MRPSVAGNPSIGSDAVKPVSAPEPLRRKPIPSNDSRPRTLTPQFHWNLNDRALECLGENDRIALYQLFRFYDSSSTGDALPAIHLERLLELLRDAKLLAWEEENSGHVLTSATIEHLFAQAVLGKLRTYLDADDEPALTFQLFCGTLFHCALLKYPELTPAETAFHHLVGVLLSNAAVLRVAPASRGLVQHAENAELPRWSPYDLEKHPPPESPAVFLYRQAFQQVIAGLRHDSAVEEQRRAKVDELYIVPPEIASHFHADLIQYITEHFRTFDVFEKGVIPREEVFALLSGMAKKLEITDVYEVLAVILAGDVGDRTHLPRGSLVLTAPSTVTRVSLAQIIHAIYICRRARTTSYQQQQANGHRKVGGLAAAQAKQVHTNDATVEATDKGDSSVGKKSIGSHGTRTGKVSDKRASRNKAAGGTTTTGSQHKPSVPLKTQATKAHVTSSPPHTVAPTKRGPGIRKKASIGDTGLLRRLSKMSDTSGGHSTQENDEDARSTLDADGIVRQDSFRSASSSGSSGTTTKSSMAHESSLPRVATASRETWSTLAHHPNNTEESTSLISMQSVPVPALRLRMFHEPDKRHQTTTHDGSICLTIELFLAPSRILTSQGVHFASNGNRDDVWAIETFPIDPKRPPEAAITKLRLLVEENERMGFALVPDREQRESIDNLLHSIRDAKCPRYAAALYRPKKKTLVSTESLPPARTTPASLERGATRVRQTSSSDHLLTLRDATLQQRRQHKKHPPKGHEKSPTTSIPLSPPRRLCERPTELEYDTIAHRLGLDHPPDAWIHMLTVNEPQVASTQSMSPLPPVYHR